MWDEVKKVLANPTLVIEELKRRNSNETIATLEAEVILIENRLNQLSVEEQRYLRLYGQGKFDDGLLFSETERVKRQRHPLGKELDELRHRQRMLRDKDSRIGEVSKIVTQIAQKLESADYELKQLALKALDVRVILNPDGKIHISGFIPTEGELYCLTSRR